jgi:hypothetical protein
MKKLLLTSCLALGLTSGLFAGTINVSQMIGGAAVGAVKDNFNAFNLGSATQNDGGALTVSFGGDGGVVSAATNHYAAPFLSGANGLGFGGGSGADSSRYLTTGIGSITFDFGWGNQQNYFGLLWGSVDNYNHLDFSFMGNPVVTVNGTDVLAAANGDQGLLGTYYVNLFADPGVYYDKVVAWSTGYAFEIDNVAYGLNVSVPDNGATVALLGLSFACLFFFRRKAA